MVKICNIASIPTGTYKSISSAFYDEDDARDLLFRYLMVPTVPTPTVSFLSKLPNFSIILMLKYGSILQSESGTTPLYLDPLHYKWKGRYRIPLHKDLNRMTVLLPHFQSLYLIEEVLFAMCSRLLLTVCPDTESGKLSPTLF